MRPVNYFSFSYPRSRFPFLFGGTFIEGAHEDEVRARLLEFPFLFGGTFIEGVEDYEAYYEGRKFPFLFGGTFIEG